MFNNLNNAQNTPYFQLPGSGPCCSTTRSARLRQRRFDMRYLNCIEPAEYTALAETAKDILLQTESEDFSKARAQAMGYVIDNCPITPEKDSFIIGGENPFLFNVMLPALNADTYQYIRQAAPFSDDIKEMLDNNIFTEPCFEGHITPGLEYILSQGTAGLRWRLQEQRSRWITTHPDDMDRRRWYDAALQSCDNIDNYADRLRINALKTAELTDDEEWARELKDAAKILSRIPRLPAETMHQALQAYWLAYILVTIEMGGCTPGGGLGLGRPDQYLYPYYKRDIDTGRLTREQALELIECWLLNFQHCDYYTGHSIYTVGSQASLGGVTPAGTDASNDLTELILEASLRINMPTPYISLRLHKDAPERFWQCAANFVIGGLGFSIVNDEVLIPAFLRHGRTLTEARDYICSCCYEFTIPGCEAFNPNGTFLNLPAILDMALHEGRLLQNNISPGVKTAPISDIKSFDDVINVFDKQLGFVINKAVACVNDSDNLRVAGRRFPMMSLFVEDCIAAGEDVCTGGARYNLTGMIVAGVPNVINSLAAIKNCVFETGKFSIDELITAIDNNYDGFDNIRKQLLQAPKWGNGDDSTGAIAHDITNRIYNHLSNHSNARGGRWQAALYSFVANNFLGQLLSATPDGRRKGEIVTRNLNPTCGTDHEGPTAILQSLAYIDFTGFPNGGTLDLRFDPQPFLNEEGRSAFIAFLKGFTALKVMQMQITMVDTATLLSARKNPENWSDLMVKVAGYSARFIDITEIEKDEIIGRSMQRF